MFTIIGPCELLITFNNQGADYTENWSVYPGQPAVFNCYPTHLDEISGVACFTNELISIKLGNQLTVEYLNSIKVEIIAHSFL